MQLNADVRIHGGDYDCSEAVRMCYAAAGVLPWGYYDSYMWTGNEDQMLTSHGFMRIPVSSAANMRRGDVLLKSGHTEMYLGNGLQGGARINEKGTIYGGRKGDQSGYEISSSAYRGTAQWTQAYRYSGGKSLNGIPMGEVAAQVMEHLISHDSAHGYGQDTRAGDGTVETIRISWDDGKKEEKKETFEEDEMHLIISIEGKNTLVWFDGSDINDLTHPDDVAVLDKCYKKATGKEMARITLKENEFARLCQSIKGGYPKHLKAIVDKYPTRSPE